MLHYIGRDIYQPIIITPFFNVTTGDFEIYVTSDLWTPAKGTANFQWHHWDGSPITGISTPSVDFAVGGLNTTLVYSATLNNRILHFNNALLYMSMTATGQLPNTDTTRAFFHENFFHPASLADAKLVDPGLQLRYDGSRKSFTVEATKGIAIWTWLDYPAGAVLHFDWNGGLLLPGRPREVGYTAVSDSTNGKWVNVVTVESLYDNTLAE